MRALAWDAVGLAGLGLIVWGLIGVYWPLAAIAAGGLLVFIGVVGPQRFRQPPEPPA
jgi:hypothetical protein